MDTIVDIKQDLDIISFARKTYATYNMGRQKWLKQSFSNRRFYQGDHYGYASFLMSTPNPTFVNKYLRKVELAAMLIETKRNMIMQANPTPMVSQKLDAKDLPHAKWISVATQNILDDIWGAEDLQYKLETLIMNALVDNIGFLEIYTDKDGIHVGNRDFYDILIPVNIFKMSDAPIVGKRFKGVINQYKENPDYKNTNMLQPRKLEQEMDFIDMYAEDQAMDFADYNSGIRDLNSFEAVEWQCVFPLSKKDINQLKAKYKWVGDKSPGDKIMRIFTVSSGTVIRDQYMDVDQYYIYPYNPLGGQMYGPSLFSRLISMNKSYDNLWSVLEEYASFATKYRIIAPRDSILTPITNQNGTIIRYTGDPPTPFPTSDLPPGLFDLLSKMEEVMQVLVNVSPSSMGMMASGSKKFKAMESQKMQDMFNTKSQIIHLKHTLKEMTKGILDLVDNSYDIRDLTYEDSDGVHAIKVAGFGYAQANPTKIGAYRSTLQNPEDFTSSDPLTGLPGPELVVIKKSYPVEVEIAQGLDYTEEAVQNKLLELAKTEVPASPINRAFLRAWIDSMALDKVEKYYDQAERELMEEQAQGINTDGGPNDVQGPANTPPAMQGGVGSMMMPPQLVSNLSTPEGIPAHEHLPIPNMPGSTSVIPAPHQAQQSPLVNAMVRAGMPQ